MRSCPRGQSFEEVMGYLDKCGPGTRRGMECGFYPVLKGLGWFSDQNRWRDKGWRCPFRNHSPRRPTTQGQIPPQCAQECGSAFRVYAQSCRLRWRGSFRFFARTRLFVSVRCNQRHWVVDKQLFLRSTKGNESACIRWGAWSLKCKAQQRNDALRWEWTTQTLGWCNITWAREDGLLIPPLERKESEKQIWEDCLLEKGDPRAKMGEGHILAVRTQSLCKCSLCMGNPQTGDTLLVTSTTCKGSLPELHSRHLNQCATWNLLRKFALFLNHQIATRKLCPLKDSWFDRERAGWASCFVAESVKRWSHCWRRRIWWNGAQGQLI